MKFFGLIPLFAVALSFAMSAKDAEKQCFENGAASFAQKTKEKIVLYGDKKNPRLSFVKYSVKNNPSLGNGYTDPYFYLIDLPNEMLKAFSIQSINEFLCGSFYPFAYPNTNELTSINLKESSASIAYEDKHYMFAVMGPQSSTPEEVDSFSLDIPGNLNYDISYPISKIYPANYPGLTDTALISRNAALKSYIDAVVELSKIKDFEKRKSYINELKSRSPYAASAEEFNKALDDFIDVSGVNENMDIYKTVNSNLSVMNEKFYGAKHLMTSNSAAFAEAVHDFYLEFDKEAKRYLKKIKSTKNKNTEKNLAEYSTQTLVDAIDMIRRGISLLGNSASESDRHIAFLLNEYEIAYTELLGNLESGNHGALKIANPAISNYLFVIQLSVDLSVSKSGFRTNQEADEKKANKILLDDGTTAILFGSEKENGDFRLLIRTNTSRLDNLSFDEGTKEFLGGIVDGSWFVYAKYLPSIQVLYSGSSNNIHLYGDNAKLLNETVFPKKSSSAPLTLPNDIAYGEKLACIFEAVDGNMEKFKEIVGTKSSSMGTLDMIVRNGKFHKLSCKDGVISYPKENKPEISPNAKLIVKKIPVQTVASGKYSEIFELNSYVKSASCPLDKITWSVNRTAHLNALISDSSETRVKAVKGWCGKETITFTAKTPKGESVNVPVEFNVSCTNR